MIELRFVKGQKVRIKQHADTQMIGIFGTVTGTVPIPPGTFLEDIRLSWKVEVPSATPGEKVVLECEDTHLDPV